MKFEKVRNLKRNAAKYSFNAMKAVKQNGSLKDMRHRKQRVKWLAAAHGVPESDEAYWLNNSSVW